MKKIKLLLGALAMFVAISFVACNNSADKNKEDNTTTTTTDSTHYKTGEYGDSANNMNNGGNYTPDERNDNRGTDTVKSPI